MVNLHGAEQWVLKGVASFRFLVSAKPILTRIARMWLCRNPKLKTRKRISIFLPKAECRLPVFSF